MADEYDIDGQRRQVRFVPWDEAGQPDDGEAAQVGVHSPDGRTLWLRTGRRSRRFEVATDGAGTWIWHAGRARLVESRAAKQRRKRSTTELPGEVTPPMPATVVRMLVETGDRVNKGQGLIVVSAMKMETTLTAPQAGVVDAIRTEVGATVRPGEVLVDVKAELEPRPAETD